MHKNRHFIYMLSCLVCMGVLLWSQSAVLRGGVANLKDWGKAVTALAQGQSAETDAQPEVMLRAFWRQVDLRQMDSAKNMLAQEAYDSAECRELFGLFAENPLIGIQSATIVATDVPNRYLVKMKWKSVISDRENRVYFCDVENVGGIWVISKIIKT
ncbi:MAG: hypothetical protein LBB49_04600 [Gracilibacteraceae bacterium]|nr:hypothetical protein [Gracilibacteraceae bacterium]